MTAPYCAECDYDRHACKGCGVPLAHGRAACDLCSPGHVDLGTAAEAWYRAILVLDAQIAECQAARKRAVEIIQSAMGDATEARIGGQPVVSWKPSKPAKYIDAKALEADLPDVAAKYTREKQPARPFKILDGGA